MLLGKLGDESAPGEDYVLYQESKKIGGQDFKCGSKTWKFRKLFFKR